MTTSGSFERSVTLVRAGFDCIRDNAACPGCNAYEKDGRPRVIGDHGVYGGGVWLCVKATFAGRRCGVVLEILDAKYPRTVPPSGLAMTKTPHGAVLAFHRELLAGESASSLEYATETCDVVGGAPCTYDLGYLMAANLYDRHGVKDAEADLREQPEALWFALESALLEQMDVQRG